MRRLGVDDRVIARLDPLPAAVAVHREVAPADRRDRRAGVGVSQARLQVEHVPARRRGRRVATVEQRVDAHPGNALARGQLHERDEVAVIGMHAARPDQADDVQRAVGAPAFAGSEQRGPGEERTVIDRRIDARQVLEHGPAGPEVQVADLRVAHLARRQPHRVLRRAQHAMRPLGEQSSPRRHGRRGDRVTRTAVADPEPVEHDEHDRSGPRPGPAGGLRHRPVSRPARGHGRSSRPVPRSPPSRPA